MRYCAIISQLSYNNVLSFLSMQGKWHFYEFGTLGVGGRYLPLIPLPNSPVRTHDTHRLVRSMWVASSIAFTSSSTATKEKRHRK